MRLGYGVRMFGSAGGLVVRAQARYDKRRRLRDEDIRLDSAEVWPHYLRDR